MATKILVLGGTGPAGICLLRELVFRQHQTVAYARNPSKIPEDLASNSLLKIVKGEMDDLKALSEAMAGCTTVISLLGPTLGVKIPSHSFFADIYKSSVFPAMRQHGIRRIFAMGTVSIKRPEDGWSALAILMVVAVRLMASFAYNNIINIADTFEKDGKDLDWTIFRIAAIPGDATEEDWKKDREDGELYTGWIGKPGWTMSTKRSALARWLVDAAEDGAKSWVKKMPAVSRKA